jgi:hypothetical protein
VRAKSAWSSRALRMDSVWRGVRPGLRVLIASSWDSTEGRGRGGLDGDGAEGSQASSVQGEKSSDVAGVRRDAGVGLDGLSDAGVARGESTGSWIDA